MNVLLSIKPKYVELIKLGSKRYEFRKKIFRANSKCRIFMYSTSPVKRIVGFFEPPVVHEDAPFRIWDKFGEHSGLTESEFFGYFKNSRQAFAIEIGRLIFFDAPLDPSHHFLAFRPPQSYRYLNPQEELWVGRDVAPLVPIFGKNGGALKGLTCGEVMG